MHIEGLTPNPISKDVAAAPSKAAEEAKLKKACQQFEALFLSQMMAQMRKSIPKGGLFGGGQEQEMFMGMLDEERAKAWAQDGGVGLANMLFQQMRKNL
ncbi:MAG: flagellar biosynthesis protein FlgJ [Candidatus Dadabacteria bacterium]|nr:MAG: flagellar biosynthesis protein FlgJ [Candidatus Dadabacteria bacterium]